MKSKHFYLRFKQPLYVKMFCTYSAIIICIVTVLTLYFISDSKKRLLESNRELVERTGRQALDYGSDIIGLNQKEPNSKGDAEFSPVLILSLGGI